MGALLIVGGSKGIGRALLEMELEKRKVVNISRTEPNIQHANLTHYKLDALKDELPEIEEIDGIVYCPGSINLKPIGSLKQEDFQQDFEVNVLGAVRVIQHYFRKVKKGNNPSIVLFSTVAVKRGMAFHASVAAAKAGVIGMSKSLAYEVATRGITVNAVAPGFIATAMTDKLTDDQKNAIMGQIPVGRMGTPEEIAASVLYLSSPEAAYVTGTTLHVNGGMAML